MSRLYFSSAAAVLTLLITFPAPADPPAHAPAHGWRKKHDPEYVGYTGTKWERDYDVASGRCNREEIGAVLGAAVGGAVGSRSSDEHRAVATILGVAIGGLLGAKIGRELDEEDRACVGHAFEIGASGKRVTWVNARTGVTYVLIPGAAPKGKDKRCRAFVLTASHGKLSEERRGNACQIRAGQWRVD